MAWDEAKPAGNQKIRLSDEEIRANWAALLDALDREHIFPGVEGSTAGRHKIPVVEAHTTGAEGRLEILNDELEYYSNGEWRRPAIPATTKMLFLQAAAPTGWTQDTSINDKVLRLVDGEGAGEGGSWEISGLTTDDHILTEAETAPHTHTLTPKANAVGGGVNALAGAGATDYYTTDSTGGGEAHNHGAVISDSVWRPAYADVIACSKD